MNRRRPCLRLHRRLRLGRCPGHWFAFVVGCDFAGGFVGCGFGSDYRWISDLGSAGGFGRGSAGDFAAAEQGQYVDGFAAPVDDSDFVQKVAGS